jgi:hypothetical protein
MKHPTFYITAAGYNDLLRLLLDEQNIGYVVVIGVEGVARVTNGKFNPIYDGAFVTEDGEVLRDVFDGVHWIERKGLKLL